MNIKKTKNTLTSSNITILFTLIYFILFEFAWINQSVIPKPSMLIESFISLISEYHLFDAFFETTAVLFPAIFLGVVLFEIFNKIILYVIFNLRGIINISSPFKYFPIIFFALLFNSVFEHSLWAEFIFIILLIFGNLITTVCEAKNSIALEYIDSAKSLGVSNGKILSKVVWEHIKPKFYGNLITIQKQTWIAVIVYEFIGSTNGIGSVYRLAYDYNDLFAIISLGIFTSIIIVLVNSILKFFIAKLVFWE